MKILVAGGTGLIGTKIVRELRDRGHDAVAAARSVGVNTYTGEGLADAMAGVDSIIDVSNSGYLDTRGAIDFFYASTLNLLSYGAAAGVGRYFALSVVGTHKLATTERSYFAAKLAQETLLRNSTTPHTIVIRPSSSNISRTLPSWRRSLRRRISLMRLSVRLQAMMWRAPCRVSSSILRAALW